LKTGRGLKASGNKAELVQRLETEDAGSEAVAKRTAEEEAENAESEANAALAVDPKSKKKAKVGKIEKTGWNKSTIAQLKEECRTRDISIGGTKVELVERLEEDDSENAIIFAPGYVPRSDEIAIATGERRHYPFQPRK
jgi:hypothetical protein